MKVAATIIFSVFSVVSYCQIGNMVPNPSFDKTKGKISSKGQIESATGWTSPTQDKADLYSKFSKIPDLSVPNNLYGAEEPNDGENYAGIVMQSFKNSIPRTYLQAELTQPMEAGKSYCVQFMVSLADIAKYACNDIGLHISVTKISSVEILKYNEIKPQILNSKNKIYDNQDMWETICGIYKAQGGEKYVTIGNFEKGTDAEMQKMQRPKGFTKPQQNTAYYYVENVSVISLGEVEQCVCEKEEKKEVMNVVYKKNVAMHENDSSGTQKQIEHKKIFFDFKSSGISVSAAVELDAAVKLLKENPDVKVEIQGHTETQEQAKAELEKLSEDRAKNVYYSISSKGIAENRLSYKGMGDTQPMSKDASTTGRAQNRRVEFVIVK